YAYESNLEPGMENNNLGKAKRLLDDKLNRSLNLFTTMVRYLQNVAMYSEKDASQRSSKFLPTSEDKSVNTKISKNHWVQKINQNANYNQRLEKEHLKEHVDNDLVKKIYQQLIKTEPYKKYIATETGTKTEDWQFMKSIWLDFFVNHESVQEQFEEDLEGWEDDKEMIEMLMDNLFTQNYKVKFDQPISEDKRQFAEGLLQTTVDKRAYLTQLIQPKLQNWDAERVAIVDLILLKMGVCELLYFPTIPTKVTINEYIELAKNYSTPQSGQFVNGVLDNLLKDFDQQGLINKIKRQ